MTRTYIDPIESGRLVIYQDCDGRICDWRVDPWLNLEAYTVRRCIWDAGFWQVALLDGSLIGLCDIIAVTELDRAGLVCAHWTTQAVWEQEDYAR